MTSVRNNTRELGAISWSLLAKETAADASLEQGQQIVSDDPTLISLRPICEYIYSEEGVLLY